MIGECGLLYGRSGLLIEARLLNDTIGLLREAGLFFLRLVCRERVVACMARLVC